MTDIPEYDDLKLRIEAGDGDSYRVVAFGPGGNTATGGSRARSAKSSWTTSS